MPTKQVTVGDSIWSLNELIGFCRKFCLGGYEGAAASVCVGD
jgi:hypothetical protein